MPTDVWHQQLIEFSDPATAELTAADELAPALTAAQDAGLLNRWWYIRKTPAWRLRYQPTDPHETPVEDLLTDLTNRGLVAGWSASIYEPETVAFGGTEAMDLAHTLFHHDSRFILAQTPASPAPLGRRETTALLFSAMLRAAGLDWFEQGDTWAKVAALRPAATTGDDNSRKLDTAIGALMTADAHSLPDALPPLWTAAFTTCGSTSAALARSGQLERGLRAVMAHHFIFHANRAGLPSTDQARLAALAVRHVFHPDPAPATLAGAPSDTTHEVNA